MAESSDVVRTFIAIPLPDAVKRFLSDIQSELKSAGWTAAWPSPERFHLTLKFFDLCGRRYLITSSNEFKFYFFISKPILIFVIHF
jgi:2'-5' RNA ligase